MKSRRMPALCALFVSTVLSISFQRIDPGSMAAQPAVTPDVRADFLRMIERRRVPAAAETHVFPDSALYAGEHLSFASEAGERVPGILLKAAASTGRRPVVIVLHGTGARKEEQLALLRALAGRGFAAVAIDARFHGERAHTASAID